MEKPIKDKIGLRFTRRASTAARRAALKKGDLGQVIEAAIVRALTRSDAELANACASLVGLARFDITTAMVEVGVINALNARALALGLPKAAIIEAGLFMKPVKN